MKDKKKWIIAILIILIIAIVVFYYINKKNDITFLLNGDENIVIEYGKEFNDPGFIAKNGYGDELNTYVKVNSNVNSLLSGTYKVTYELDYNNIKKELVRIVVVKDIDIRDLKIELNGDDTIYLLKGSTYTEEGAEVYNIINYSKFENGELKINGEVDTANNGTYEISYELDYKGQSISISRKIIVFDIGYKITPEEVTTNKVKIILDLDSVESYSYTKLPDGYTVVNKNVEYEVSSNGTYTFTVVLQNKEEFKKDIVIDNIIGKYTCSGEITSNGTKITVSPATSEIKEYEWLINNKTTKGTNIYNEYKIINKAKVNLVLSSGKKYELTCSIKDNLIYHFTYDLKNTGTWTKPEMECKTYSAADKTKYDKMLKDSIKEAGGKGTRGGVVAAARFLVGAMDHRVRYQGPKKTNSQVGKYAKEGLNIGQNNAWGCRVGGYTQGMDCTHFIEWVLVQNGIKGGPYSFPKSNTSDVIDKVKPGDLVYVACGKSCSNPSAGLSHVGIVVGVDREKEIYYIAESVPGTDGKLGVTMHATKKKTVLSAYTLIGTLPFTGEGNVNDMWLME